MTKKIWTPKRKRRVTSTGVKSMVSIPIGKGKSKQWKIWKPLKVGKKGKPPFKF